mgnify:CR=1 FL=1
MYAVPHRIETARLVLRRYARPDAEQLVTAVGRNVDHLRQYMEWIRLEPLSVDARRAWIADVGAKADAGEDFALGVFLRSGELVGGCGFHVRHEPARLAVGYWIDRDHQGRGLATEAAAALDGHLCRCGAHDRILKAVVRAGRMAVTP